MYPRSIQKLIDLFSKFPTVGKRTAARFVFYLLNSSKEENEELTKAILELRKAIKICSFCYKPFENEEKLCEICSNPLRDRSVLCIVEKETDLMSLENTRKYKGIYFILGGTVSSLKKEDIGKLRGEQLIERIQNPEKFGLTGADFKEIIVATNPTPEGESTALYIERALKTLNKNPSIHSGILTPYGNKKITRLGRGLPVGGELEYADEETLSSALEGRK